LQTKLYQFLYRFDHALSRAEWKCFRDLVVGMLKSRSIYLAKISRCVDSATPARKIQERFRYHLQRQSFGEKIMRRLAQIHQHARLKMDYVLIDDSDISKPYARKMENLGMVRDGSQSTRKKVVLTPGYHWLNVLGVRQGELKPLDSCVYSAQSVRAHEKSQNSKILSMIERLAFVLGVIVMDRGGDRRVLIKAFLAQSRHFIIRQNGTRHVGFRKRVGSIRHLARKVQLTHRLRLPDGVRHIGITKVQWLLDDLKTPSPHALYMLVMRGERGQQSYYLCHLPTSNHWQAMSMAITGYGHRWSIEEYHRQVKQDFSLEKIKVMTYPAIQNLTLIVLILLVFLAKLPQRLLLELFTLARLMDGGLKHLPDYLFYKITEAVHVLLRSTVSRQPIPQPISLNLCLNL
jgi:hypothetical protein